MAATEYGKYVKSLSFKNFGQFGFRQGAVMDGRFLGLDVHISYGAYWTAGKMSSSPKPHTHDFDQMLFLLGTDMNDLSELGAEVELCLGEEMNTHIITSSAAVAIPKGMPHFPAAITRMDKRIIYMEISLAPRYSEQAFKTDAKPSEPVGFRSKYGKHVMPMTFRRKGAWYYGSKNRDDGGGHVTFARGNDAGINFTLIYESIKKAPYRIGPEPDNPHAHANTQVMLFLGSDPEDLSNLGAEFEICMGKEQERHVFTKPTAVVTPPFLPHWPGGALKLSRPMIMMDIHPGGDSVVGQVKK
ncbi:MAG TPA: hypothetical protein VMB24_03600 [Dehalococcoidales bacterium]|nr:hypothetical protein [Dehalococcoidales bacterium]